MFWIGLIVGVPLGFYLVGAVKEFNWSVAKTFKGKLRDGLLWPLWFVLGAIERRWG